MTFQFKGLEEIAMEWISHDYRFSRPYTVGVTTPDKHQFNMEIYVGPEYRKEPLFRPGVTDTNHLFENTRGIMMFTRQDRTAKKIIQLCSSCNVFLPKNEKQNVVPHAWISTILYSKGNAIDPKTCDMYKDAYKQIPRDVKISWGQLLVQLAIEFVSAFRVQWIGLQDGSFITKCGKKTKLTDFLHRKGSASFYERFHFMPIHKHEYEMLSFVPTYMASKRRVLELNAVIEKARGDCLDEKATEIPECKTTCQDNQCKKVCTSRTVRESGKEMSNVLPDIIRDDKKEQDEMLCDVYENYKATPCMKRFSNSEISRILKSNEEDEEDEGDVSMVLFMKGNGSWDKQLYTMLPQKAPRKKEIEKKLVVSESPLRTRAGRNLRAVRRNSAAATHHSVQSRVATRSPIKAVKKTTRRKSQRLQNRRSTTKPVYRRSNRNRH